MVGSTLSLVFSISTYISIYHLVEYSVLIVYNRVRAAVLIEQSNHAPTLYRRQSSIYRVAFTKRGNGAVTASHLTRFLHLSVAADTDVDARRECASKDTTITYFIHHPVTTALHPKT